MANLGLRLAKAKVRPVDYIGAFSRGFDPAYKERMFMEEKEKAEKRAQEEAIRKQKIELEKDIASGYKTWLHKSQGAIPANQIGLATELSEISKNIFKFSKGIEDPMERLQYQNQSYQILDGIKSFFEEEKEVSAANAEILDSRLMSKANQLDSDDFKIALKRNKGEYEAKFDGEKMIMIFDIDGEKKQILAEDLQNYNILPKATDVIKNNNDVELSFMKYVETQKIFPSSPAFNDILQTHIDKMQISNTADAISVLVDHFKIAGEKDIDLKNNLNKLQNIIDPSSPAGVQIDKLEGFKYVDVDNAGNKTGDILTGEEAVIEMVKDQYAKVLLNAASNLEKQYKSTIDVPSSDEIKLTSTQRLRQKETQERIESTKNSLAELSLPIKDGKIDFDSNSFVKELNKYNSIITKGTPGGVIIKNIDTRKELEFAFDMTETGFKRAMLQLAGATPLKAKELIPAVKIPRPEDEKLIGNITDYSQYIKPQ
jgi:hypothetical protein